MSAGMGSCEKESKFGLYSKTKTTGRGGDGKIHMAECSVSYLAVCAWG